MEQIGKLTLIGAGPGDPDLLTIKGAKALSKADIVLYDALVNEDILEHCAEAKKVFVGKRLGYCKYSQEQINELIIKFALEGHDVVRLKGGDSFVFGRGYEEMLAAAKYGIKSEVIPGISSCISVPAVNNIPVTSRGATESFWVITGTTKKHQLSQDIYDAAKCNATVVVLMGVSKIKEICEIFSKEGKFDLPVAVIQEGSTKNKEVVGSIATIADKVANNNIKNPAIIIIGKVVNERAKLANLEEQFINSDNNIPTQNIG